MQTSLYTVTIPVFEKSLKALSALLDKGAEHAKAAGTPESDLLNKQFAPDMFPLKKQVQIACDTAKVYKFRINGGTPPSIPDTEETIAELKARIDTTLGMLKEVAPADIDGKEANEVRLSYFPGKKISGLAYTVEYVLPNFFFHITTAYDLLRAEGVTIGKGDYIGGLSLEDEI